MREQTIVIDKQVEDSLQEIAGWWISNRKHDLFDESSRGWRYRIRWLNSEISYRQLKKYQLNTLTAYHKA